MWISKEMKCMKYTKLTHRFKDVELNTVFKPVRQNVHVDVWIHTLSLRGTSLAHKSRCYSVHPAFILKVRIGSGGASCVVTHTHTGCWAQFSVCSLHQHSESVFFPHSEELRCVQGNLTYPDSTAWEPRQFTDMAVAWKHRRRKSRRRRWQLICSIFFHLFFGL